VTVLLALAAAMPLLAAQPALRPTSPYLDAVRQYERGREAAALAALAAARIEHADDAFGELDDRVCAATGARSCGAAHLGSAGNFARAQVVEAWRRLYPRALGLHIEALAACHPHDRATIERHRVIVLRLIARLEEFGRDPSFPPRFAGYAPMGRHMLLWVLQYLRHEDALQLTLDWFEKARLRDRELRLARGSLEELRTMPNSVEASLRQQVLDTPLPRDLRLAHEEKRRLGVAAATYQALLTDEPDMVEAHLRLAHLLVRLGRHEEARAHLGRVLGSGSDARQTYLARLFLADVHEQQGDRAGAIAAYRTAQSAWPAAQSPALALARLHTLEGDGATARAALSHVHREPPRTRTDPWGGYTSGQAWRLPAAIATLQAGLEPFQ
jgi:tetratricopeptide (TPR) repeat protein